MTKFQIIVLSIFGVGLVGGLLALALVKSTSSTNAFSPIEVWGTLPQNLVQNFVSTVNLNRGEQLVVNYIQKTSSTFEKELVENLALGKGPDAVLIPQDMILSLENKIIPIPYTSIDARAYKNSYIEQAELYLRPDGALGLPFMIDPLVTYWNRDMYTNAGLATYPKVWDEFVDITKKITQKDVNSNIRKTAIALGEFTNITNARDIFSLILLQAGTRITARVNEAGESNVRSVIGGSSTQTTKSGLDFFTSFSNPSSPVYSWNRALPSSKDYFLAGNLATYFGFASEVNDIKEKNPNLNFDIAPVPQIKGTQNRADYSRMYGFSIIKSTRNAVGTYAVLNELVSSASLQSLVNTTYLPPVRRDLIAAGNTDPYLSIFYDAALISKGWLDPSPSQTSQLFQNMVEAVTSGRELSGEAISQAQDEMDRLIKK